MTMTEERRAELLKRWPAPWKTDHGYGQTIFKAPGPLGASTPIRFFVDGVSANPEERRDLADLLVEAWNGYHGAEDPNNIRLGMDEARAVAALCEEAGGGIVHQVKTWKNFAAEVVALAGPLRLTPRGYALSVAQAEVLEKIAAWKRDSEELAAIRAEEKADSEDAKAFGAALARGIQDLVRQDCRRAAARLRASFDWSKAETALAAEVIFGEVRGASRPREGDQSPAPRFVSEWEHFCDAIPATVRLWIKRCPHCGKERPATC